MSPWIVSKWMKPHLSKPKYRNKQGWIKTFLRSGQRTKERGQRREDKGKGQREKDRGHRTKGRGQRQEDKGQRTNDKWERPKERGQRTDEKERGQSTEEIIAVTPHLVNIIHPCGQGDVLCKVEGVGGHLQHWQDAGQASVHAKEVGFRAVNHLMKK